MARTHYQRLARPPRQSFFLLGIRGVGKSTWVRDALPAAHRVDLLDEGRFHELSASPSAFGQELAARPPESWVVVDEIQRLPRLLNEVHRAIEERGLQFALLGSSARKLKAAGINLLAGRALARTMLPLTVAELGDDFELESTLKVGSVPLVVTSPDPRATLESYVQLYLREEIRVEALVRNLPSFTRFLDVAAALHAQTINLSSIARDVGAPRATVEGYVEILEDTLMAVRIPAFEPKLRVRERKRPKLFWVDPGILRACRRRFGPVGDDERGALFEGLVLHLLRAHSQEERLFDELSHWSIQSGLEVDFVLRRDNDLLAIEVKSGHRFHPGQLGGLRAIGELRRMVRRIVVHPGERELVTEDGIEVWGLARFSKALESGVLWP